MRIMGLTYKYKPSGAGGKSNNSVSLSKVSSIKT